QLRVTQGGLYRACLCIDWPQPDPAERADEQVDLRDDGVCRLRIGQALALAPPGQLTRVDGVYDWLVSTQAPGVNAPPYGRSSSGSPWNPGTVPGHGVAAVDVVL